MERNEIVSIALKSGASIPVPNAKPQSVSQAVPVPVSVPEPVPELVPPAQSVPVAATIKAELKSGPAMTLGLLVVAVGATIAVFMLFFSPNPQPIAQPEIPQKSYTPNASSVAILPFKNTSNDPGQGVFADGLTDDLITDLSKIEELKVVPRHSSFQFQDVKIPPQDIARELNVRYLVLGSVRQNRQDSVFRRLSSRLINHSVRASTGVDMHDYGCMLRAYRKSIVEAMIQYGKHGTFIPVLANSFANHTAEIDVHHAARDAGESRYDFWKLIRLQFDLVTSMTTWPLRALTILGGVMAAAGFALGLFLLLMRIIQGPEWAVDGTFTLFAVLFVFIGGQFTALGLLGEYIGRIYESRSAPWFLVRRTTRGRAEELTSVPAQKRDASSAPPASTSHQRGDTEPRSTSS